MKFKIKEASGEILWKLRIDFQENLVLEAKKASDETPTWWNILTIDKKSGKIALHSSIGASLGLETDDDGKLIIE